MPTPACESGDIGEELRKIREREGRSGGIPADDLFANYTLEFRPASEAPANEIGIIRFAIDVRKGKICKPDECFKGGCGCFSYPPLHWAPIPRGWKDAMVK